MNTIENQSSIDYGYQIDPFGPIEYGTMNSNVVSVNTIYPSLQMVKTVDKAYATIGDILTYTINITNIGDTIFDTATFIDSIPNGTAFVPESVTVDSVPEPTYDPSDGFELGTIGVSITKVVTFQVTIVNLVIPNIIANRAITEVTYIKGLITESKTVQSNIITTAIHVVDVSVIMASNISVVQSGDTLIYTTVITNNGNINITDVLFSDFVASRLIFIPGSVTVNNMPQPTYDPITGFSLGTIGPLEIVTVIFKTWVS